MKKLSLILAALLVSASFAVAQSTPAPTPSPTPATTDLQNFYAAGMSYSAGASPSLAGTGLYAHLLDSSGTYAFTAIDVLPQSVKPFTVTDNVGVGVAQKLTTIGKYPIYASTTAGISWTGANTGWQWNTGAMTPIKIKDGYYIVPSVRLVKSSVSNGSGYQPIVGILFGWGK